MVKPIAPQEYERTISLPIWPGMTGDQVDRAVEAPASILGSSRPD
jgi:dTDP-4-amino-4,6-dideoxygalactose transaminase